MTFTPAAPVLRPRRARVTATALFDAALREHAAGLPAQLWVTCSLGTRPVPLARWCAASQACEPADVMALEAVLSTVPTGGAVLDLGCGPGRHTGYLADRGLAVVGVDTSRRAVAMTRARGARAVWGDGLGSLPTSPDGAGCWDVVLLLDGNIGIGGDPHRLLRRVRELLTPTGRLLVELDVDGVTAVGPARLDDGVRTSAAFPWARLSLRDLPDTATATGLAVLQEWTTDDRAFAFLGQVPS